MSKFGLNKDDVKKIIEDMPPSAVDPRVPVLTSQLRRLETYIDNIEIPLNDLIKKKIDNMEAPSASDPRVAVLTSQIRQMEKQIKDLLSNKEYMIKRFDGLALEVGTLLERVNLLSKPSTNRGK